MYDYLEEIRYCVETRDKKEVISLINKMKNFYMTEEGLKLTTKKPKPSEKLEVLMAVGRIEDDKNMLQNVSDKPRKHTFY